eukprot:evm.model.scf_2821.2 EVM.evm.TU.scf_2821.2   scf_2821:11539-16135(+)
MPVSRFAAAFPRGKGVLVFLNATSTDAVCASLILFELLDLLNVAGPQALCPVSSNEELREQLEKQTQAANSVSPNQRLSTLVFVNCGSPSELSGVDFWTGASVFILDHREFSRQQLTIPEVDVFTLDGTPDEGEEEVRRTAAMSALAIAHAKRSATRKMLQTAMVGIEELRSDASDERMIGLHNNLRKQAAVFNPPVTEEVRPLDDFDLPFLRHSSLLQTLHLSPSLAPLFKSWTKEGRKRVGVFLIKMGYPENTHNMKFGDLPDGQVTNFWDGFKEKCAREGAQLRSFRTFLFSVLETNDRKVEVTARDWSCAMEGLLHDEHPPEPCSPVERALAMLSNQDMCLFHKGRKLWWTKQIRQTPKGSAVVDKRRRADGVDVTSRRSSRRRIQN